MNSNKDTIGAMAVGLIVALRRSEADAVVKAVRAKFPGSKFDRGQFNYYSSALKCGRVDRSGCRVNG